MGTDVAAIETGALTKRYGRHRGIEEVSFEVRPGEVFGFLGPNGAGMTTTIRTLLDLIHPTAGAARIFGLDSRRDSVAIRARLGNLPGDSASAARRPSGRRCDYSRACASSTTVIAPRSLHGVSAPTSTR